MLEPLEQQAQDGGQARPPRRNEVLLLFAFAVEGGRTSAFLPFLHAATTATPFLLVVC